MRINSLFFFLKSVLYFWNFSNCTAYDICVECPLHILIWRYQAHMCHPSFVNCMDNYTLISLSGVYIFLQVKFHNLEVNILPGFITEITFEQNSWMLYIEYFVCFSSKNDNLTSLNVKEILLIYSIFLNLEYLMK